MLVMCLGGATPSGAAGRSRTPRPMVWHVERQDGTVVSDHRGEELINPASVVKIGTTLWALERLGPDYRFETRFLARGTVSDGILHGDLVVHGSGDPDFQPENAFLVADALNSLGIRRVTGALVVNGTFWIGWEGGSERTQRNAVKRGLTMAGRLRTGLDPRRWPGSHRRAWLELAGRRGLERRHPPRVVVEGGIGVDGEARPGSLLVVHRSKPLVSVLRRFNAYSNNDIERLGAVLGPPEELAALLSVRCDAPADLVRLETTSGLGTNRLTPRLVVRLLREIRDTCRRVGVEVTDVLPLGGCDPGTVSRFFPVLADEDGGVLVGKTGTLTTTDGGVSVLAGFLSTSDGELLFCVAVPRAGGRINVARRAEQAFLLQLLDANGGPRPRPCGPPLPTPDEDASVIVVAGG